MNALTLHLYDANEYRAQSVRCFGALIAGLVGAGVSAATAIYNARQQQKANEYTKQQNQLQQDREDNSVQRRLQDVRAAGFSPLVAANLGGAGTGGYTPLDSTALDTSGVSQGIQTAGQGLDTYRLAKRQQDFSQQVYDDAAGDRANQSVILASNASKAVLDADKYGIEKNVAMDTAKLAYDTAKVQASDAHQAAVDAHNESVLRRAGMTTDNAQKVLDLQLGNETFADRVAQIRNATSLQEQQKALNDVLHAIHREQSAKMAHDNFVDKQLDRAARDMGYKNWQHYMTAYEQQYRKDRDSQADLSDAADKLTGLLGTVLGAVKGIR